MSQGLALPFAILDESGRIVAANPDWLESERDDAPFGPRFHVGSNYLNRCRSALPWEGTAVYDALIAVLSGERSVARIVYGCPEPGGYGRSEMRVGRFELGGAPHVMVLHTGPVTAPPVRQVGGTTASAKGSTVGTGTAGPRTPFGPSPKRLKILVAEDEPINQDAARSLLEEQGHSVTVVENGREAVRALEQQDFDLAFMDLDMPMLDGFAATGLIRVNEKETNRHLPVVATVEHGVTPDKARFRRAGMDDVLAKPLDPARVLAVLDHLTSDPAGETGPEG